jgi:hypothetical protein
MDNELILLETNNIPWKDKLLQLTNTFPAFFPQSDGQKKRVLELKDFLGEEVNEAARALFNPDNGL